MSTTSLLEAHAVTIETPGGRTLVRDLSLRLGRERVALIGRNGVGKTTLLEVLAERRAATQGRIVCRGRRILVPQHLAGQVAAHDDPAASPGERRRQLGGGSIRIYRRADLDAAAREFELNRR